MPNTRDTQRLVTHLSTTSPMKSVRLNTSSAIATLRANWAVVCRGMLRLVGLLEPVQAGDSERGIRISRIAASLLTVLALIGLFAVGFAIAMVVHRPPVPCPGLPAQETTIQVSARPCPTHPCTADPVPLQLSLRTSGIAEA